MASVCCRSILTTRELIRRCRGAPSGLTRRSDRSWTSETRNRRPALIHGPSFVACFGWTPGYSQCSGQLIRAWNFQSIKVEHLSYIIHNVSNKSFVTLLLSTSFCDNKNVRAVTAFKEFCDIRVYRYARCVGKLGFILFHHRIITIMVRVRHFFYLFFLVGSWYNIYLSGVRWYFMLDMC